MFICCNHNINIAEPIRTGNRCKEESCKSNPMLCAAVSRRYVYIFYQRRVCALYSAPDFIKYSIKRIQLWLSLYRDIPEDYITELDLKRIKNKLVECRKENIQ